MYLNNIRNTPPIQLFKKSWYRNVSTIYVKKKAPKKGLYRTKYFLKSIFHQIYAILKLTLNTFVKNKKT